MKKIFTQTILAATAVLFSFSTNAQTCNASFTYVIAGNTVTFTSTSTGVTSNTLYSWSFGDTQTSTTQNPVHTYTTGGTYIVCLGIADFSNGCVDSACQTIVIPLSGVEDFSNTFVTLSTFPNPSNTQTSISYSTSVAGDVSMEVFDVLGNKVSVIENSHKAAGNYETKFDTQNLNEGIYFVRITINGREAVTKLTVVH